jgi:tetraacyldisaccharide 4'-kinase
MTLEELARRLWQGDLGALGAFLDTLLMPAEAAYRAGVVARNRAYDAGTLAAERATVPVISVGNVAVGGTGKTPFANWLARGLADRGERPAILHGGYAADEPELHRRWSPGIPVYVGRDRAASARTAIAKGATVLVLDDAFQHRRLHRDLDIVLVAAERWRSETRVLPRGPWREPVAALARAGLVVVTRKTATSAEAADVAAQLPALTQAPVCRVHLRASGWRHAGARADAPAAPAVVVSGLAEPRSFVEGAGAAGAVVANVLSFPDHHAYTAADAGRIRAAANGGPVVTTEKDWTKLDRFLDPAQVWLLTQDIVVEAGESALTTSLDEVLR